MITNHLFQGLLLETSKLAHREELSPISGSHFLKKKTSLKMLLMNLTLLLAVSMPSFRNFDRVLMPTHTPVKGSESLQHVTRQESQVQSQASRDPIYTQGITVFLPGTVLLG